jgi:hypothetical protein
VSTIKIEDKGKDKGKKRGFFAPLRMTSEKDDI